MKKLKYTATRVFNWTSVVTTNIDYTHEVLKKGNPSWKPHQISDVKIGDVVLSYDLDKHNIVDAKVVGRIEESLSEQAETFEFETLNKKLKLTTYHSLPYYRDDKLIEDSVSTLEVGDKVISVDSDLNVEFTEVTDVKKSITNNDTVYHPRISNDYYFVNRVLIHD
jgi:hypothetical protein